MKKIILYVTFFIICVLISSCRKSGDFFITEYDIDTNTLTEEELEKTESDVLNNEAYVYVCGAVIKPGVYKLSKEAIKDEAICLAGGFAEGASKEYINLAEHITDGEQIYVPYESELEVSDVFSDDNGKHSDEGAYTSDGRLNINKASKEDFMTLTGIGEARAEAIIAYRDEHGLFESTDEIMNVNGIKEGVYNNIKDYITLN